MADRRMAIIIVGYDGYADVWTDFFELYKRNWPDCPYKIYLADNEKGYDMPGLTVIHAGEKAEWSQKVQRALEVVEEKYICLLLEDFFFSRSIDSQTVSEILDLMDADHLKYYKLNSFSKIKTPNYKKIDYLHVLPKNMEYAISLLPCIWEKSFLKELVGEGNYDPWKFEVRQLNKTQKASLDLWEGCVYDDRNVLQIRHGIVQGKYIPDTIKFFRKSGYEINQGGRSVLTFRENFVFKLKMFYWPKPLKNILKYFLKLSGVEFAADKNG